jgi:hypothetical protein
MESSTPRFHSAIGWGDICAFAQVLVELSFNKSKSLPSAGNGVSTFLKGIMMKNVAAVAFSLFALIGTCSCPYWLLVGRGLSVTLCQDQDHSPLACHDLLV